jgi:hypothetical protein
VKRENSQLAIIEDEFCELFCKNMLEQSLDYHNYKKTLIQKLVNNGYEIYEDLNSELSEQQVEETKQKIKELKTDEKNRITKKILESPNISSTEYNKLIEMGVSTEEDECKIQKYNIIHSINIRPQHLTEEYITKYNNSNMRHIIKNIKQCFAFIRNENGIIERIPVDVLIRENANNQTNAMEQQYSFLDQKKYAVNFHVTRLEWINERIKELGFEYVLSPESIDASVYENNLNRIIEYYANPRNYQVYVESELLFGKHFSKQKQTKLDKTFLLQKISGMFGLTFGTDKVNQKVYQQINFGVCLYDETQTKPNLLGHIIIPQSIVQEYDTMFMRSLLGNYCEVCDIHFKQGGITFTHLTSKKHLNNVKKQNE